MGRSSAIGFARDSTESQQLIDAEESEHQYRLLADSIPQIVFRCDRRVNCWISTVAGTVHGQMPIRPTAGYAGAIHPDDLETCTGGK
jgi:PAS domain-containing protein